MSHPAPRLADLHRSASVFNGFRNVDVSWLRFLEDTAPSADLTVPEHRVLLLRWLNSWGCRIRYPRDGEPAPFDSNILAWWSAFGARLPQVRLAKLTDRQIAGIGTAYGELASISVSASRTLGPTAASKALYALRPKTIMPWDAAIAERMYGGRSAETFVRHLTLGRAWANAVVAEAGTSRVPVLVGRPKASLAKILDEYLYVTITMTGGQPNGHRG